MTFVAEKHLNLDLFDKYCIFISVYYILHINVHKLSVKSLFLGYKECKMVIFYICIMYLYLHFLLTILFVFYFVSGHIILLKVTFVKL